MKRACWVLGLLLAGCSCGSETVAPALGSSSGPAGPVSAPLPPSAVVSHTGRTSSPEVALRNLSAQLEGQRKMMAERPVDLITRSMVFTLLVQRSRILGSTGDLIEAVEIAEKATEIEPNSFHGYVLRGRGRAAAHRFQDALADYDAADKVAKDDEKAVTVGLRASVWIALGRYDEALPIVEKAARLRPTSETLADHAVLLGHMGMTKEAQSLFVQAEQKYRGPSPFGLADLYFDRASMWEKQGNLAEATTLYRAAHDRLPSHAHVATHLAALVPPSEGVKLLEPVVAAGDDPEVLAQLGILQNLVADKSGDASIERARKKYDELEPKLPFAWADHAGWFWLSAGKDSKKALAAAKRNLESRKTADAYELLLAAGDAAGDDTSVCQGLKEGLALKYQTPRLKERARQLQAKVKCAP